MQKLKVLSAAEQVAKHLREGVAAGAWRGEMPGGVALAEELGVNHKTVEAALSLLEREGVLVGQGARRARRINPSAGNLTTPSLRIGILLSERDDERFDFMVEIRHRLIESGHVPFVARRTLAELGMNPGKVAALVGRTPADAWLVVAGSRRVMEWFAAGTIPFFGLFGLVRRLNYAGAGPDKAPAYAEVVRTFAGLGHRRIVLLAREQRHLPIPGYPERHFLQALGEAGIESNEYHFPLWEDNIEGFHRCLEVIFRVSPPTALLVQEPMLFAAVQQFLAARGIRVTHDVSLVCDDPDPTFAWQVPTVAHIRWDSRPWVRRVVRWADNIARGKIDRRRILSPAEFVPGGTIGPVARRLRGE
ncbi:MAG TPA: substrate-binding domain-containing protein [Luteolibacter sp.]|nr:substrate-binding domain-containing protein [Luteolibacter sp.]